MYEKELQLIEDCSKPLPNDKDGLPAVDTFKEAVAIANKDKASDVPAKIWKDFKDALEGKLSEFSEYCKNGSSVSNDSEDDDDDEDFAYEMVIQKQRLRILKLKK